MWETYAKGKQKGLGFDWSFMVHDAFKAQKRYDVKMLWAANKTNLALVPAGCTSKCQPLDVCINKPFKDVLRSFGEDYVAKIVTNLTETKQQLESYKLPSPSRQDVINLIAEGITQLTFTCPKFTIETLEKGVKYIQS